MKELLQEFLDLFNNPSSLPSIREVDHRITLKEGTEPVNVRPYRYAHYQKNEIEKQVQDMLTTEIVRPSTSPFSSPVLLVKKEMGTRDFVQIIALSMLPLLRITCQSLQLRICSTNSTLLPTLQSWLWERVIIKYESIHKMSTKLPSEHIMGIMNTWSCHLAYVMHLLRSRLSWIPYSVIIFTNLYWFFLWHFDI
jgi:hypothetical protein